MKAITTFVVITATLAGCAAPGPGPQDYRPIIDTQGLDHEKYSADLAECQQFARQSMDAATGAIAGALAGALLGAAIMPRGYRDEMARSGAILGGVSGGAQAFDSQTSIIKRCVAGRGYKVLN